MRAMAAPLTDAELKGLMKQLARVSGPDLTDERVDRDLAAYKRHLAAIERINTIDLPITTEPAPMFVLKRQA